MNLEVTNRDETRGKKLQLRSTGGVCISCVCFCLVTLFLLTRQIIHFISKSELYLTTFGVCVFLLQDKKFGQSSSKNMQFLKRLSLSLK